MASVMFNKGKTAIGDGSFDYLTGVVKAMLMKSTYSPNPDSNFVSDISADESAVTYTRQTLASKTVTQDDTNNRAVFDCADLAFGTLALGHTLGGILFYVQTGGDDSTPSNDILLAYHELTDDIPTNGSTFSYTINAAGIFFN